MNETAFKCKVLKFIKKELPGCWCVHICDKFHSGIPDIFIVYRGYFAAIELKVGRNIASRIQLAVIEKLNTAGAITAICRDSAHENGMDQIRAVIAAIKTRAELPERRLVIKENV